MKNMSPRVQVLKQLVTDGHYVIDESAVAEAVVLRANARRMLPDVTFRSAPSGAPQVQSFRPHTAARSFRLTRDERRAQNAGPGSRELAA